MATLPYVTAPGNIEKALIAIKSAATPERVTQDFVKTILKIPGGSGDQITAFLRKTGFVNQDGTPSETYKRFRNVATSGSAIADALKVAYSPLYRRNEFMHALSKEELKGIVIEETGAAKDSSVPENVVAAIEALKKFANFNSPSLSKEQENSTTAVIPRSQEPKPDLLHRSKRVGMNLSYTINLNLPATSDIAVFNAIFKSLKENLLSENDEA
ncbi:MAG TPA: DUF5343 domain-containing protein [Verrucomicrobiae bacterium]|jgi:hypothetical protein|nr:DUF5343 domain-containing protein [Verrucomicrobiae bacterium]